MFLNKSLKRLNCPTFKFLHSCKKNKNKIKQWIGVPKILLSSYQSVGHPVILSFLSVVLLVVLPFSVVLMSSCLPLCCSVYHCIILSVVLSYCQYHSIILSDILSVILSFCLLFNHINLLFCLLFYPSVIQSDVLSIYLSIYGCVYTWH